jgi:Acyl-CoA dehydrogenase, C-terminal domain
MLDERWPTEQAEVAAELRRLLADACAVDVVRAAEAGDIATAEVLAKRLTEFGIAELPRDPVLGALVAGELGRALAPVRIDEEQVTPLAGRWWVAQPTTEGIDAVNSRRLVLRDIARVSGAMRRLLELGASYAAGREQFGQPIGSFQAVAHRLADVAVAVDGLELLVRKAAWVASTDSDGVPGIATTLALISATGSRVDLACRSVHQVMAGFGFSSEADTGLFSERLRGWARALPLSPRDARRALGSHVVAGGPASTEQLWGVMAGAGNGLPLPRWAIEVDAS